MSELRSRTFTVELRRDHSKRPWGLRITGGCDVGAPLIITRAQFGTPCDGVLKPGDKIRKIGDYDARDIRHQDAQNLFHNAGTSIKLVVQRDTPVATVSGSSSRASSVGPSGTKSPIDSPYVMAKLNTALLDPAHSRSSSVVSPHRQEIEEEIHAVTEQPYRTTPLVLPGAKVKKDAAPTESYLRHHPNPAMRAPPPNTILLPHDVVMKHKVADSVIQRVVGEDPSGKQVVHKQFNSPIGLYSNDNIKETIHTQTGITPNFKKTVVYDPAKSETYKALQEVELGDQIQEVTVPVQTKVFSPSKAATPKKPVPYTTHAPHPVPGPYYHHLNSLGVSNEEIQQSNSFKRLMYMVMSDN